MKHLIDLKMICFNIGSVNGSSALCPRLGESLCNLSRVIWVQVCLSPRDDRANKSLEGGGTLNGLFSLALPKVNIKGQGTYGIMGAAKAKSQKGGAKESQRGKDADLVKEWQARKCQARGQTLRDKGARTSSC